MHDDRGIPQAHFFKAWPGYASVLEKSTVDATIKQRLECIAHNAVSIQLHASANGQCPMSNGLSLKPEKSRAFKQIKKARQGGWLAR